MKIGNKVKVIKDNYLDDPLQSLSTVNVKIGDVGFISRIVDTLDHAETILVKFEHDAIYLAPDELEII